MEKYDDNLIRFEAEGAAPLPLASVEDYVENQGAKIWYASYGSGLPVVLLHGGMGSSRNWGYQVPALLEHGYQVILMDSRGHGRSTRDQRPYSYQLMASDLGTVLDTLLLEKAALVGWSDGADTALIFADLFPERVNGVFFYGCNMDDSGLIPILEETPILSSCMSRQKSDYEQLSETPDQFQAFFEAVGRMQRTQPNYSAQDLARIHVPVWIVQSEHDEFIKREHAEYLAKQISGAEFVLLENVSHFAPLQRPDMFNKVVMDFLERMYP